MRSTESAAQKPNRRQLLTCRVPPELRERLVAMAKEQGRTLTEQIETLLQQALDGGKPPAPAPDKRNSASKLDGAVRLSLNLMAQPEVMDDATSAILHLYTRAYGAPPTRAARRARELAADPFENFSEALTEVLAVLDLLRTILYGAPRPRKRGKGQSRDG